jgi:hypothetical protein
MYCGKCGYQRFSDDAFCGRCGTNFPHAAHHNVSDSDSANSYNVNNAQSQIAQSYNKQTFGKISAIINVCAMVGIAVFMPFESLTAWAFLFIIIFALSCVPLMCAFAQAGKPNKRAAGYASMAFAAMSAVFFILTFLAIVSHEPLDEPFSISILYWVTAYYMMALSAFFAGLTIDTKPSYDKAKRAVPKVVLKILLMINIAYAIILTIVLIGADTMSFELAVTIQELWCVYYIWVGALSIVYFMEKKPMPRVERKIL